MSNSELPINLPPITPSAQPQVDPKHEKQHFQPTQIGQRPPITLPGVQSLQPYQHGIPAQLSSGQRSHSGQNAPPELLQHSQQSNQIKQQPIINNPSHGTQPPQASRIRISDPSLQQPPQAPRIRIPEPSHQQPPPGQPRQLNVKDALSYLELVKFQFSSQPEIYHRFLEIMKDFKNQVIDTPQVIERVSSLFRSHPNLITGFNTFLPPGYSLEPTNNPDDPVRVTTPQGLSYRQGDVGGPVRYPAQHQNQGYFPSHEQAPVEHQPQVPYHRPEVTRPAEPSASYSSQVTGASNIISSMNEVGARNETTSRPKTHVEFNHAIGYVNKIKSRFANKPETYRCFLEILQTYQKEDKPISEVYAQVQYLFHGAPDLLEEFKQFLPDNSNIVGDRAASAPIPQKKLVRRANPATTQPYYSPQPVVQPLPPKKKVKVAKSEKLTAIQELDFFDRCKEVIGNKTTYNEFLKILNLFTQEIIEAKVLIERVEPFLGKAPELFDWFKRFVKYEEDDVIYNIPADKAALDLRTCRQSGHSYRRIPNHIPRAVCSGRDELARDVLSDDWISIPVFISESGFISHKKTPHEEAMYKCEEERYEFSLNIESNRSVIALLEPIAQKILLMPNEERATFKLPPGLGGSSTTIYKRIIKKIYDVDRGLEVIDALHQNPAVAVPIVLKRLKQKDEEWRRSQREWNKVWREIDNKNFSKAVDHQGISFKLTDRKAVMTKSLINEIEVIQHEQKEKKSNLANRYQFDFSFKDESIFEVANDILMNFIESAGTISSAEEEKIQELLNDFLPQVFAFGKSEPNNGNTESGNEQMELDPVVPSANDAINDDRMDVDNNNDNGVPSQTEKPVKRSSHTLYTNNHIYCFFRLYQMLYSRLLRMKEVSEQLSNTRPRSEINNPVAVELGLKKENFTALAEKDRFTQLHKDINLFINGDLDANEFEDKVRELFWTSGYLVFTIDKLVHAVVKQIQIIIVDSKCFELMTMFYRDKEKNTTGPRQEALYRLCAEQTIQEDNVYRIEYFFNEKLMTIQLLGKEDQVSDETITTEEKWSLYVDQFVQLSQGDSSNSNRREPFCKRNLPAQVGEDPPLNVETRSGLELKICVNTYKIFFVDNTEDYFRRKRPAVSNEAIGAKRSAKFRKWLESEAGWKRGLTNDDAAELMENHKAWMNGARSFP